MRKLSIVLFFSILFSLLTPLIGLAAEGSSTAGFKDTKAHWAEKEIQELASLSIVNGFTDGTFQPNLSVTREQFIKMLVELKKYPLANNDIPFKDVPKTQWSRAYISTGLKKGILIESDFPKGFEPTKEISRFEMAVWIARAIGNPPDPAEPLLLKMKDEKSITKYRGLVEATMEAGIVRGLPDGTFGGEKTATRAEAATMLVRAIHYQPNTTTGTVYLDAPNARIVLQPGVKVLTTKMYSEQSPNQWLIKGEKTELKAGDLFVLPPNEQYMNGIAKRVQKVTIENGSLLVVSSDPKMEEVLQELKFNVDTSLDPSTFIPADPDIQTSSSKSTVLVQDQIRGSAQLVPDKRITKRDHVLTRIANQPIFLDYDIDFSGIRLSAAVDYESFLFFPTKLNSARAELIGDIAVDTKIRANLRGDLSSLNIPSEIEVGKFSVPIVPGSPLTIDLGVYLQIQADFSVSVELRLQSDAHLGAGFAYNERTGFRPINNSGANANFTPTAEGRARASVGAKLDLAPHIWIWRVGGINLTGGGKGDLTFNAVQHCAKIDVDAFLKIKADILDSPALTWTLFDRQWEILRLDACAQPIRNAQPRETIDVILPDLFPAIGVNFNPSFISSLIVTPINPTPIRTEINKDWSIRFITPEVIPFDERWTFIIDLTYKDLFYKETVSIGRDGNSFDPSANPTRADDKVLIMSAIMNNLNGAVQLLDKFYMDTLKKVPSPTDYAQLEKDLLLFYTINYPHWKNAIKSDTLFLERAIIHALLDSNIVPNVVQSDEKIAVVQLDLPAPPAGSNYKWDAGKVTFGIVKENGQWKINDRSFK